MPEKTLAGALPPGNTLSDWIFDLS